MGKDELFTQILEDPELENYIQRAAYKIANQFVAEDPEDISQELYLRVYEVLDNFDPERGSLRVYVKGVVSSRGKNFFRGKHRYLTTDVHVGDYTYFDWLQIQQDWVPSYSFVADVLEQIDFDAVESRIEKPRTRKIFRLLRQGCNKEVCASAVGLSHTMVGRIIRSEIRPIMEDVVA